MAKSHNEGGPESRSAIFVPPQPRIAEPIRGFIPQPLAGLVEILKHKRPHESKHERKFVFEFIVEPLRKLGYEVQLLGPMGNIVVSTDDNSKTLFSCHTDTVHREGGLQDLAYDKELHMIYNAAKDGGVLGADDGTGIWIMLEMLRAKIPGTYVFHRGEERGGVGSRWMASNREQFLRWHSHAIAFDRKGTASIITHQRGSRCCSEAFSIALSKQLGEEWSSDSTGTFTDTANYTHLIQECTNLSVGYYDQHSKSEVQDAAFAVELLDKLKKVDWASLPAVREAKREVYVTPKWEPPKSGSGYGGYSGSPDWRNQRAAGMPNGPAADPQTTLGFVPPVQQPELSVIGYKDMTIDELDGLGFRALRKLCLDDPDWAADKLMELFDEIKAQEKDHEKEIVGLLDEIGDIKEDITTVDSRMDDLETMADNIITANVDRDKRIDDLERKIATLLSAGAPASKTVN
jgi:hypothetical protein